MDSTAYVDESFRGGPDGCYVIAAVLVPVARADDLRFDLRQLFANRRRRFHWHSEEAQQREQMLEFVAQSCLPIRTVSKALPGLASQERVRAHCLERLLWELKQSDARRMVLESRQERNNVRDRRTILAAQVAGKAADNVRYDFGLPQDEPLLWIADAVASAVAAGVYSQSDAPFRTIASALQRVAL